MEENDKYARFCYNDNYTLYTEFFKKQVTKNA